MSGGQSATEASSLPSAMRGASRRSLSSMSAASAALAFDTSRLDAARLPVVVEIGERLTKVGYANELVPRAIIRTEFLDDLLQRQRDVIRVEEQEPVDDNPLVPPPKPYNKLYHFILKLYMSILLTTPHDRRVVVVESVLASSKLRRALATIFLERLEAVSLLFVPSHLTATFPFNVKTALVIDLGYREAVAIPVAEGVTLLNQLEVTTRSTKRLEDRTRDLLYAHGQVQLTDGSFRGLSDDDKKRIEELNIVEDIVVRFLFVTTVERGRRIQSGEKNEQDAPDVRLPFRHEFLIIPGFVRETAAEVLFEEKPSETELVDEPTLSQLVHSTIARCTIDLRTKLFGSLLFVGGLSKLQGLLARLKQEIIELGTQKGLKNAGPDHVKFIFSKDPGFELYANWLGGSMFGSLTDVSQLRSVVTREDWQQRRTLPDWTDFIATSEKAVDGKGRV